MHYDRLLGKVKPSSLILLSLLFLVAITTLIATATIQNRRLGLNTRASEIADIGGCAEAKDTPDAELTTTGAWAKIHGTWVNCVDQFRICRAEVREDGPFVGCVESTGQRGAGDNTDTQTKKAPETVGCLDSGVSYPVNGGTCKNGFPLVCQKNGGGLVPLLPGDNKCWSNECFSSKDKTYVGCSACPGGKECNAKQAIGTAPVIAFKCEDRDLNQFFDIGAKYCKGNLLTECVADATTQTKLSGTVCPNGCNPDTKACQGEPLAGSGSTSTTCTGSQAEACSSNQNCVIEGGKPVCKAKSTASVVNTPTKTPAAAAPGGGGVVNTPTKAPAAAPGGCTLSSGFISGGSKKANDPLANGATACGKNTNGTTYVVKCVSGVKSTTECMGNGCTESGATATCGTSSAPVTKPAGICVGGSGRQYVVGQGICEKQGNDWYASVCSDPTKTGDAQFKDTKCGTQNQCLNDCVATGKCSDKNAPATQCGGSTSQCNPTDEQLAGCDSLGGSFDFGEACTCKTGQATFTCQNTSGQSCMGACFDEYPYAGSGTCGSGLTCCSAKQQVFTCANDGESTCRSGGCSGNYQSASGTCASGEFCCKPKTPGGTTCTASCIGSILTTCSSGTAVTTTCANGCNTSTKQCNTAPPVTGLSLNKPCTDHSQCGKYSNQQLECSAGRNIYTLQSILDPFFARQIGTNGIPITPDKDNKGLIGDYLVKFINEEGKDALTESADQNTVQVQSNSKYCLSKLNMFCNHNMVCGDGKYCDLKSNQCKTVGGEGSPCNAGVCSGNLYCSSNKCIKKKALNTDCGSNMECESSYCAIVTIGSNSKCAIKRTEGQTCRIQTQTDPGLLCVNGLECRTTGGNNSLFTCQQTSTTTIPTASVYNAEDVILN